MWSPMRLAIWSATRSPRQRTGTAPPSRREGRPGDAASTRVTARAVVLQGTDAMIPWRRRDLRCCGWEPQLLRSTMYARAGSVLRVATKGTLVGLVRARVAGAPRSDILQSLGLFVCWVGSPMHCRCTAAETIQRHWRLSGIGDLNLFNVVLYGDLEGAHGAIAPG